MGYSYTLKRGDLPVQWIVYVVHSGLYSSLYICLFINNSNSKHEPFLFWLRMIY